MERDKYVILSTIRDDGEIKEDDITLVEMTPEEVEEYMEATWSRDTVPDILIPVELLERVFTSGKVLTIDHLDLYS